ncbi:type II toxin-antitoxin system VapC family toxin [Aquamicrobium sp. LC103]|uniref:type II toxin-antitoxin system VapC family toxin n=1 Tax=Aquamicrobium sp. LC103 TaxID=1120658 RepID=UPI00109C8F67|nr:type II toxin-antitoxin system VapC family toxin [Aquamicrobium sp. LC103]TKT75375.1 type II toxin-antitoxin system VapC family toxin [Aquamicrobium sp. LC103]
MTTSTLVDSNVLIDILGPAGLPARAWSLSALRDGFESGPIVLSAIVWAELSHPELPERRLLRAFEWLKPRREDFPFSAASLAGTAHRLYRARGGTRDRTLPDFLIGAHASVAGHRLLTRDAGRYRAYFPDLEIIAPDMHS